MTLRQRVATLGILGFAFGYFAWYVPYALLTKILSSGNMPGYPEPVNGLVLLPSAALGTLAGAVCFLAASGWWRHARRHRVGRFAIPGPGRVTLIGGTFTALIIGTTTLNYTFVGASILFMLLLMRGGVLSISPVIDALRGRTIHRHSWVALGLSLTAVAVAVSNVDSYVLTAAAVLSVGTYLLGYVGRFELMARHAKTGSRRVDRGYFVEEHISAAGMQVVLCAVPAFLGPLVWAGEPFLLLREGFTEFLFTPGAIWGFGVGLLYEVLFIFGTLIYLDPREYTWCVPVNRCASLFSGIVASYLFAGYAGADPPGATDLTAAGLIVCAVIALSYPAWRRWLPIPQVGTTRAVGRLLFVCGGNTSRSPMAAAIARAELDGGDSRDWVVTSAGVDVRSPGAPLAPEAATALRELGVRAPVHRASRLTPSLCTRSTVVWCMTRAQRDAVIALAPQVAGKTFCLDPKADIPDPAGGPVEGYRRCAVRIQGHVRYRITELSGPKRSAQG
ncbi:MAG: hypothetical protein ACRDPK_16500 [Carbonactinosporaceae bacterium]